MSERWRIGFRWALLTAAATAVGSLLATFGAEAFPLGYLTRPILVALGVAVLIACAAAVVDRSGLAAFGAVFFVLVPGQWLLAGMIFVAEIGIQLVQRARARPAPRIGWFAAASMFMFLLVGLVRVLPAAIQEVSIGRPEGPLDSVPIYLVMLDGYPRIDTLEEMGHDNGPFIEALVERGFDHYPGATSVHGKTSTTLAAMLAGSAEGIHDDDERDDQAARLALVAPAGFTLIDPPVGHVTMVGGTHLHIDGINDFETHLLGRSLLGLVARDWTAELAAGGLRRHLERSLELVATTAQTPLFAHLLSPHPPFLYAGGLPPCWPHCDAFTNAHQDMRVSEAEWKRQMAVQVARLNAELLTRVDQILERQPDAVIVLFSDHGSRYSATDTEEWHRPFLVSRTPHHPDLFADHDQPHFVLRLVMDAYGP